MKQVVFHGLGGAPELSDEENEQQKAKAVSMLQEMLGYDHLMSVFAHMDGFFSARLALVCKDWHRVTRDPLCWEAWCAQVWWRGGLQNQLRAYGTWQEMFINRPHVRFDRLYLLERSWFRPGAGSAIAPVGTVVKTGWYRYLRFRPQGKVLYALVANPLRSLKEHHKACKAGQYIYHNGMLEMHIDMEYMDGFMQAEFVSPARGGLMHDGLKVRTYNAVYKGDKHSMDPPGVFELQQVLPKNVEEAKC